MTGGCSPDCGCDGCTGVAVRTPVATPFGAGLAEIPYRTGRHGDFLASMRATLAANPRAAAFTASGSDDPTIALCDAAAAMLDGLGFYQERIANEHYLRTATERRSIAGLAALTGYRPAPGVAASTDLAFTVRDTPGHPPAIPVPVGVQAQHVPKPGETAQTFETTAPIEARAAWNAIPLATGTRWTPVSGDTGVWLAGIATGLTPGDALLIVGEEREADPLSNRWDLRIVTRVAADPARGATEIAWDRPLGSFAPPSAPSGKGATVHALRIRAALFGAAAPDPALIAGKDPNARLFTADGRWKTFGIDPDGKPPSFFDLDTEQSRVVPGGWIALASADYVELYRATAARTAARAQYGLAAKVTRVTPDTLVHLADFPLRATTAFCASEPLPVAERPIAAPLYGTTLTLAAPVDGIAAGRRVAITGQRQRIRIVRSGGTLAGRPLQPGERLTVLAPPTGTPDAFATRTTLSVRDEAGREGIAMLPVAGIALAAPDPAPVSTVATVAWVDASLHLDAPLPFVLDRASVRVNANVAPASVGQSVAETLGGSTGRSDQRFVLRQAPLTYAPSTVGDGRASTLAVRVNTLLWHEVTTLVGAGPDARVFTTAEDEDGRTLVIFGDGSDGAIPPRGQENIRATYRRALGSAGNVAAGTITTLLTRPLGLADVVNPAAASGGQDGEAAAAIATTAPARVATLGRAVSVEDYAQIARGFGGIGKARADWIAAGPGRGVLLTVAGDAGTPVAPDLTQRLAKALAAAGDPHLPVRIVGFRARPFVLQATVRLSRDADPAATLPLLSQALVAAFGFPARRFGQMVSVDEVAAVLHRASSALVSATVTQLHTGPTPGVAPRLFADLPVARLDRVPDAAELLTLAAPPVLEVAP